MRKALPNTDNPASLSGASMSHGVVGTTRLVHVAPRVRAAHTRGVVRIYEEGQVLLSGRELAFLQRHDLTGR